MAEDRDTEALLREIEQSMSRGSSKQPKGSGLAERIDAAFLPALLAGAVTGAAVWALFLVVPFLGSVSGGVGAFLAAFVVSFLGRIRH